MTFNPIVLADGKQERWPAGAPPKELLLVDREPILLRTIRLFEQALQTFVYVYTRKPAVIEAVSRFRCFDYGEADTQLEAMARARPLWRDRQICLLGDVYYSEAAVEAIAACRRPVAFYGRRLQSELTGKPWGELVAMAWNREHDEDMLSSLHNWKDRPLLWSPYRDFAGLWLPEGENYLFHTPECLVEIDDWTDDFDSPEEYQVWLERRAAKGAKQ